MFLWDKNQHNLHYNKLGFLGMKPKSSALNIFHALLWNPFQCIRLRWDTQCLYHRTQPEDIFAVCRKSMMLDWCMMRMLCYMLQSML